MTPFEQPYYFTEESRDSDLNECYSIKIGLMRPIVVKSHPKTLQKGINTSRNQGGSTIARWCDRFRIWCTVQNHGSQSQILMVSLQIRPLMMIGGLGNIFFSWVCTSSRDRDSSHLASARE